MPLWFNASFFLSTIASYYSEHQSRKRIDDEKKNPSRVCANAGRTHSGRRRCREGKKLEGFPPPSARRSEIQPTEEGGAHTHTHARQKNKKIKEPKIQIKMGNAARWAHALRCAGLRADESIIGSPPIQSPRRLRLRRRVASESRAQWHTSKCGRHQFDFHMVRMHVKWPPMVTTTNTIGILWPVSDCVSFDLRCRLPASSKRRACFSIPP